MNPLNIIPLSATVEFLAIQTRLPLKFGPETLTHVLVARVHMKVTNANGQTATGRAHTPLSVPWAWPSSLPHADRQRAMSTFCEQLAAAWSNFHESGHPVEIGHAFLTHQLPALLQNFNRVAQPPSAVIPEPMPHLAALICSSAFDLALHDAYGLHHNLATYATYKPPFMNRDLAAYLTPADPTVSFKNLYPDHFLLHPRQDILPVWHLVGGKDWLEPADIDTPLPTDNEPYLLRDWIRRDGLTCLKIKLRGTDPQWDYTRIVNVGKIAIEACDHPHLCTDFNCTALSVSYVTEILDRLQRDHPDIYNMILYVEQPFAYDLEKHPLDVRPIANRKLLFMDESAHNPELIALGRSLGWTGVALKTCKTQTIALLSQAWAKAHGMAIMVQDLTNPMLAQIPHVLLAAHAGTLMGLESNAMQFYPEASAREAAFYPTIYHRRNGTLNASCLESPGFSLPNTL